MSDNAKFLWEFQGFVYAPGSSITMSSSSVLVDALVALGQMQLLGVRMTHLIEPRLVIEADGVHDQRVAVLRGRSSALTMRIRSGGCFAFSHTTRKNGPSCRM